MLEIERDVEITRELAPFAPENQLGIYHIRRWTWYEKQGAFEKASTIIDAKKGLIQVKLNDLYAEMMAVSVRRAPEGLEWNVDLIKTELDADVGDTLREICREINGLTDNEKSGFLSPSEPEKDTPG